MRFAYVVHNGGFYALSPKSGVWCRGSATLASSPVTKTLMNSPSDKKPQKSHKPSQSAISLAILASTVVGTLGSQGVLDADPGGEWGQSHDNLEVNEPDSTVAQDGKDNEGSRTVSQAKRSEDREHPALGTPTPGVVDDTGHGNRPTGECFQPSTFGADAYLDLDASSRQSRPWVTLERGKASL